MSSPKKIVRRNFETSHLDIFSEFHPVLRRIFAARKVNSPENLEREFKNLIPYQAMSNIEKAAHHLADALSTQKRLLIVGDFDADGATSTALAMRALKQFGATSVNFIVPNRFLFGYGLTPELIEAASEHAPELIITVDNGIANHKGVNTAKEMGIPVIITDHHLPAADLPDALVIVNPNLPDDSHACKNLAGVGVIFYVMLALRRELSKRDWFTQKGIPMPNMASLLDLVALGTVADLIPLDQNNRILVHQGLQRIRVGQCIPGIIALLEVAGRDFSQAEASDLGFAVAARLNAAGRLDDMSLGIECLLSDDPQKSRAIAHKLHQLNKERRSIEQEMQFQAVEVVDRLNLDGNLPKGICLYDQSWHQGVIGILAARIKDKYHRPVIIFANGTETELKGSARSIAGLHIRDVLARIDAEQPGLILKYGGHAMAAGLSIAKHLIEHFTEIFDATVSRMLSASHLEHTLLSDGELSSEDLSLTFAELIKAHGPWGQAYPEPLFDDHFAVLEQRIVGDKHLKLKLSKGQKIFDAIHFFAELDQWPNHRVSVVHAAYRLDVNEFKGRRKVQLIVEYLVPGDKIPRIG